MVSKKIYFLCSALGAIVLSCFISHNAFASCHPYADTIGIIGSICEECAWDDYEKAQELSGDTDLLRNKIGETMISVVSENGEGIDGAVVRNGIMIGLMVFHITLQLGFCLAIVMWNPMNGRLFLIRILCV